MPPKTQPPPKKLKAARNKFSAQPVVRDGIRHDSKLEARWADKLSQLESLGIITNLCLDKERLRYELKWGDVWICHYTADAKFDAVQDFDLTTLDGPRTLQKGQHYVADAKSPPTRKKRDYKLVKNMMLAAHGVRILEL